MVIADARSKNFSAFHPAVIERVYQNDYIQVVQTPLEISDALTLKKVVLERVENNGTLSYISALTESEHLKEGDTMKIFRVTPHEGGKHSFLLATLG